MIDDKQFDLRSICIIKSKTVPQNTNGFDSIRYMRHGNSFKLWWKQEREDFVCSQCKIVPDILSTLIWSAQDHFFVNIHLYILL